MAERTDHSRDNKPESVDHAIGTTPGRDRDTSHGDYPRGGANAASVGGAGAGGDIDNPDVTGAGGLEDLADQSKGASG